MIRNVISRGGASRFAGIAGLALAAFAFLAPVEGEEWMQFRGPGSSGVGEASNIPATWDENTNIVWKTNLPGPGGSSPIVVGDKIYVTSYSGYAESKEDPGNKEDLMRHLICLERGTGKILWTKDFKAKQPESDYVGGNNTRHGYATSTPVSDGTNVYVFMGISGVMAFDLDGNPLWTADVGSGTDGWGSATSPVLYKNLLIVNASVESESLVALNKATGEEIWRAPGIVKAWCSPVLVETDGKTEIVMNLPNRVVAYEPATGGERWSCEGVPDFYICPSVVAKDGVVYATGGRRSETVAVKTGGSGDVTATHLLWRTKEGNNVTSPVVLDGYLYWMHESRGKAMCLDAATGAVVYEADLDPKPGLLYASITAVDGKLFAPSQDNGTYVLAARPEFEQLAVNTFADDTSRVNASIVVSGNQLLLHTDQAIYCIGQ